MPQGKPPRLRMAEDNNNTDRTKGICNGANVFSFWLYTEQICMGDSLHKIQLLPFV